MIYDTMQRNKIPLGEIDAFRTILIFIYLFSVKFR